MPEIHCGAAKQLCMRGTEVIGQPEGVQPVVLAMFQAASRQVRFDIPEHVATLKTNRQLGALQAVGDKANGVAQLEALPGSKDKRAALAAVIEPLRRGRIVVPGIE